MKREIFSEILPGDFWFVSSEFLFRFVLFSILNEVFLFERIINDRLSPPSPLSRI